jgi:hypothetical protein
MIVGEGGGCAAENDRNGKSNPGLVEHGRLHLLISPKKAPSTMPGALTLANEHQ